MIRSLERENLLITKYNHVLIIVYIDILMKIMFLTCSGRKTTLEVSFSRVKAPICFLLLYFFQNITNWSKNKPFNSFCKA